jgi:hypothetical protein
MGRQRGRLFPIRALVTVVVAVTIAAGAILAGPPARRARAQEERPAVVVAGTCDNPGEIAAELRPLTVAEGGAWTSFTTIDLPIDELTSGDYAIVAGAPDAPVACGEVAGEGTDVYLSLPARDETNLSAVAWLHARDDRTQVSVFAGENLGGSGSIPIPPEDDPSGPPEPPGEETPEPSSSGESVTYESPSYGYSLTYDPERWQVGEEETRAENAGLSDYLFLHPGTENVMAELTSIPNQEGVTADEFTGTVVDWSYARTDRVDVSVRTDDDGDRLQGGDENHAFVTVDFTLKKPSYGVTKHTVYYEVWMLSEPEILLVFTYYCPQDEYEPWTIERDALLAGLQLPE